MAQLQHRSCGDATCGVSAVRLVLFIFFLLVVNISERSFAWTLSPSLHTSNRIGSVHRRKPLSRWEERSPGTSTTTSLIFFKKTDINLQPTSTVCLSYAPNDDSSDRRNAESFLDSNDKTSTNMDLPIVKPITRLVTAIFKGVTLPFPMLKELASPTSSTKKGKSEKKKMQLGFSLRESILAIVLYLTMGVVSYSSTSVLQKNGQQAWSLVDALYFGVVTFTSVGYGDLCPTTVAGKVFTILFGLSGIALLGAAVATIGSQLIARESAVLQAAEQASRKRILHLFQSIHDDKSQSMTKAEENDKMKKDSELVSNSDASASASTLSLDEEVRRDDVLVKDDEAPIWWRHIQRLCQKSVPAIVALVGGGLIMGKIEGWSAIDSIYYAFITAGTLGYGDFSPLTRRGRLWGIVFIPLAVAAAGEVLGNVASVLTERRQEQYYEALMDRELNVDRLLEMDGNEDGKVSKIEYVEFMLKEMDLVSDEQFQDLHDQFQQLDSDGNGYLNKDDIKSLTKKE